MLQATFDFQHFRKHSWVCCFKFHSTRSALLVARNHCSLKKPLCCVWKAFFQLWLKISVWSLMDFFVIFVADNVKTDRAVAMGNGIYISWNSFPNMTCGYIVKWCHSSGSEPCSVDWQKFPSNTTDAVIKSGKSEISFWVFLVQSLSSKWSESSTMLWIKGYCSVLVYTDEPLLGIAFFFFLISYAALPNPDTSHH